MKGFARGLCIALIIVCAAVLAVGGIWMVKILMGYDRVDKTYESINESFEPIESLPESDYESVRVEVTAGIPEGLRSQYEALLALKEEYPDVVGYLSIPAIDIAYPVVQTDNNDYYLDHLITGEENDGGSIFLDYFCEPDPAECPNSVLYGHNMNNRSMFHNLEKVFELESFQEAWVVYITEEGIYLYRPFTAIRTDKPAQVVLSSFDSDQAFVAFCDRMADLSRFPESRELMAEAENHLITMVTCTNSLTNDNERLVYQALLSHIYTAEER